MFFLVASLFLTRPVLMDMPRAESYLVSEGGALRLEDRYSRGDLWLARTLLGSWVDEDGRLFSVARLETGVPEGDGLASRADYSQSVRPIARRDEVARRMAMSALSPVPLSEDGLRPRQKCRGYKDIVYWHGTNESVIVCEFRPERTERRYLAVWSLVEEDDQAERIKQFEDQFLAEEFERLADFPSWRDFAAMSESEAFRADAHDSVTNCADWHWTDVENYTILDNLNGSRDLVTAITNLLPELKASFVQALPTPLDGTNTLGLVRVFGSREDYLAATDESLRWTAAYWSPVRREIVAHLPREGLATLLTTFRHEAFHQYLSYATAMIPVSPWLNEGYAQYFEDRESCRWDLGVPPEDLEKILPRVFDMDYEEFYAGDDRLRQLKYRLAWSVAVFLEKGARKVRNDPFATLKRDYLKALVNTQDMRKATEAAFGNADRRGRFVYEWKKFWKDTLAD